MSEPEHFDCVIIGSGEAGKYTAWTLGSLTGRNAPLSSASVSAAPAPTSPAAAYGLGSFVADADHAKVDMPVPQHRKVALVDGLMDLRLKNFQKANAEVILGEGRFLGPKTFEVAGRTLTGDVIIVNTGTRALVDSTIPGLVESKPLTHVEILDLDVLPSHLIILGGGYVGLEFAQAYRRFGPQVTVIEKHDRALGNEDEDVVEALVDIITGEGVRIITSAKVDKVAGVSGDSLEVSVNVAERISTITASHILVATGRVPNTENMGLEEAGIKVSI